MSDSTRQSAASPTCFVRGLPLEVREMEDLNAEFPSPDLLRSVRAVASGGNVDVPAPPRSPARPLSRTHPNQLLNQARLLFSEAEQRLQDAEVKAAQMEREAYEKGFQQGEAAGMEMGQAKLSPLIAEINSLLAGMAEVHSEVVKFNRDQLVDLGMAIATKIVHRELEQTPEQILHSVEEVLSQVGREQRVRLRLSQIDFQMLLDHQTDLPALARMGDRVTFEVDPEMIRGGCLVQTPTGTIDATIETMLAEMRRELSGHRSSYHSGAANKSPSADHEQ